MPLRKELLLITQPSCGVRWGDILVSLKTVTSEVQDKFGAVVLG